MTVLRWIYSRYWGENHSFYCNGLGNLHNIRHGEMIYAELDCALLEFFLLLLLLKLSPFVYCKPITDPFTFW